jgi:hypothetical protein
MRVRSLVALVLLNVVAAPALAGFAGTDLFIPMAGRGVGAYPSNWFTTVYLYNPNPTAVSVDLSFLERNKDNVASAPPKVTETLAAGETRVFENIVEAAFGKTAYGAVRIQCAQKVVATARVFSKESADAPLTQSFGQDAAATPASFAIGLGESTDILGGYSTIPYQDSAARFNVGCVETTGLGSATVRWVARDGAGQQQKSYDRVVPRLSQTQGFFHQYFDGIDLTNSRVSASVVAGSGRVICYGSLVTNDKEQPKPVQDPTTFEMVYPEKLLGIATVQHDATLKGDGTSGSLLGLADRAVSQGKLSAAGGAAGQVLGTDGTVLRWQDAGLQLPFFAISSDVSPFRIRTTSASNSSALVGVASVSGTYATFPGLAGVTGFSENGRGVGGLAWGNFAAVEGRNDGSGAGVEGSATGGTGIGVVGRGAGNHGVYGGSVSADGVRGESGTGVGVHGTSTSGDGVFGEAYVANKTGVLGANPDPGGWAGFFAGNVGVTADLACVGCVHEGDLADGAVTKAKLLASGGTNGQILGTTGDALEWRDAALKLPFSGSGGGSATLFEVTSLGNAPAISGFKGTTVVGTLGATLHGGTLNGALVAVYGEAPSSSGSGGYAGVFNGRVLNSVERCACGRLR